VDKRLGGAGRLTRCIDDPRCPDQIVHSLADMIGFRMKMIAAGYEDGNDATRLRSDPIFKMAEGTLPSGRDLASSPERRGHQRPAHPSPQPANSANHAHPYKSEERQGMDG
jgi:hypothetical protein